MQFELTHHDLKEAIHEFIKKKGVAENNEIDMLIKTSRKGGRTSRAIITVLDTPIVQQAPVGAGIASFVASVLGTANPNFNEGNPAFDELEEVNQLAIPFSVDEEEVTTTTTTEEVEEVTEPSPTFKRLFA